MASTNNRILKLYKSRTTVIKQLQSLEYKVGDYSDFSINEIDAMNNNSQLDLLVTHRTNGKKVYVKYNLNAKQLNAQTVDNVVEDLYSIDAVLTNKDTLMIITDVEPNETILSKIRYLYDHSGIFIVIHNINRLQYNLLSHTLVPKARILGDTEVEELKKSYNILKLSQLPEISRFDPHALALCLRPGEVCEFTRDSATALNSKYYRVCLG
jgi:DNA-directed RNA polymerase subunit H (RpoH/RPB5)/DNA-directed RNA polymerase subunit F